MTAKGQVSAWRIGWGSAKANAVPMAVRWCLAAATVAACYLVPGGLMPSWPHLQLPVHPATNGGE